MKKLLFILPIVILFASCGNDSDIINLPEDTKTYDVTFNVSNFKLETTPLNSKGSVAGPERYYYRYIIYKQDGSLLKDSIKPIKDELTSLTITEKLPAGKYNLAIMTAHKTTFIDISDPTLASTLVPENFNTDYCFGNVWVAGWRDNKNIYYNTIDFNIGNNAENSIDLELDPMWSTIDVNITDAATCGIPDGTTAIKCVIDPFYYGFNIKTKVSSVSWNNSSIHNIISSSCKGVEQFRESGTIPQICIAESKNITVKAIYLKRLSESDNGEIIGERIIYKGNLDKGIHYKFTGALGNYTSEGETSFNITKKGFSEKEIPF